MSGGFRLGFLTHVHGEQPAAELYPRIVELFVTAEELGFDSGWVAQHHFSPREGRLPSPLVLLSHVAAHTRRIRLGTAVATATFDDPIRLAEDAVVLDTLSRGRVELGLGSGNPHPEQFAAFGRDVARRREDYAAHRDRLLQALAGEELAPGVTLEPAAAGLAERVWESPVDPSRVRDAAQRGTGVLLGIGPGRTVQAELAEAYLDARGAAPARLALVHAAFLGPDRARVREELWPPLRDQLHDVYVERGWIASDAGAEELLAALNVHHGTADDIISALAAEPVLPRVTDLVLAVQSHETSIDRALAALETIARDIAPRLGWRPGGGGHTADQPARAGAAR